MEQRRGILALDLSSNVGWAYGEVGINNAPASGVWRLADGGLGRMLASFENELEDAILLHQPALILTEAPLDPTAASNHQVWRQQISLAGIAETAAWRHDILFREQSVSTIRTKVLGTCRFPKGQAKDAVMAYCQTMGWRVYDHNAADACVLWKFGTVNLRGELRLVAA
jgi:hypothetical protein